jgi:ABC-type arginine transport system permease subunit
MSETYRTALQSIGHGQLEAAQALGLKRFRIFQKVMWPQMYPYCRPDRRKLSDLHVQGHADSRGNAPFVN